MYFRIARSVFNNTAKLSKKKINKNVTLIFPTSLTVPKLLACYNQCFLQNYSSSRESLDKRFIHDDNEYNSDEQKQTDNEYQMVSSKNTHDYFNAKDQEKLDMLLKDNPEMQKLKRIIQLELLVMQQDSECVPSKLEPREWIEVLALKSKSQRRKYYKYLFINEKVSEKVKKEKEEKRIVLEKIREQRKNAPPSDELQYGFAHNFLLRRISNTYINHHLQWNSLRAIMYGNKLVFDCSYDNYMSIMEARSCARQLNESYSANRAHDFPFEIFFTNVNPSGKLMDILYRFIPILYEKDFPFTITEKSYLDIFDRSKLCYLSSNAPSTLEEYDHETVYIIGAYVDKGSKQPVSFSKARREGIRMAKLPLDKYIHFGSSAGRDLTLNQMCNIMLDIQCKSWKEALKHVPVRKLEEWRIRALENKIRSANAKSQYTDNYENGSYNPIKKSSNKMFSSAEVHDFSHSARAKLRERWRK